MGLRSTMALLMALLGAAPGGAGALKLRVLSRQRECVQEVASEVGEVITGSFIADGGEATAKAQASNLFMPKHRFDLVVMDPNLNTVYTIRKKTDHRFEIPVKVAGSYTFCFNNQARTAAHVMYHAHVGHHVDHGGALAHHLDPLTDSVQDVREHISKMKQEYYYQRGREEVHRRTNDNTNYRVILSSVLEAIALVGCSVVQVLYVRKQFAGKDNPNRAMV